MAVLEERRQEFADRAVRAPVRGAYFIRHGVSWSGIWAGAFVAMALQLLCGLLGVWANANSLILGGQFPLAGISGGVGIWYLIYTIAAMLAGGFTAAQQTEGIGSRMLHGLAAWAVASMIGFFALAVFSNRLTVGMATPAGNVITGTQSPGIAMVSPGWLFGGLLLGLIASLVGASLTLAELPPEV